MSKCCSAALEPKRIVSAVRKVAEGEDRSRNVVVFGKPEFVLLGEIGMCGEFMFH